MGPPLRCSIDKIAKRIDFPVDFVEYALAWIANVSPEAATAAFGEPQNRDFVPGLGDSELWAYEFDCGLRVAIERIVASQSVSVHSNRPEPDHIARHLQVCGFDVRKMDAEVVSKWIAGSTANNIIADEETYRHELSSWQLWRQDDNGNRFAVGTPTSEIDARCHARQLESLGHKQTYWAERVARSWEEGPQSPYGRAAGSTSSKAHG